MSRRCLICSNINPCRNHSEQAQADELRRNDETVARIRAEQKSALGMAALGAVHSGSEGEAEAPGETKNPTPESKG
jgi:hypothetical protein